MIVNIKDKNIVNTFVRVLVIQVICTLITISGTLIDGVIITRFLGPSCMAASGLIHPLNIMIIALSFILNAGSQALAGNYMGKGQVDKVNQLMNLVVFLALGIGIFFNIIFFVFTKEVAILVGATGDTLEPCIDYLKTFSFSATGVIITPILVGFLQIDRDGKRALVSSVVFLFCSITLDLLNVLVFHGGMLGMGLTTAISYAVSVIVLFSHFVKKNKSLTLSLKLFSFKNLKTIIALGFPAAIYHICNFVRALGMNRIALSVKGTEGVFVYSILGTISAITMAVISGFGIATLLVSSILIGEENRRAIHHTLRYILLLGLVVSSIIGLILSVIANKGLTNFFCTGDAEGYKEMISQMLIILGISIPFTTIDTIMIHFYQSMKKIPLSATLCTLNNTVYVLLSAFILSKLIGINGVWLGLVAAELLTMTTILIITSVKQKKITTSVHDLIMLPKGFGIEKPDRLNISITKLSEISGMSQKIIDFCRSKGIDEKTSKACGLCMEELSGISMGKGKKNTVVDIYLTYKDGNIKLRLRDNGIPNKPEEINPQDESENNLGMRIVQGMAKKVNYSVVLGLNVFSLEL